MTVQKIFTVNNYKFINRTGKHRFELIQKEKYEIRHVYMSETMYERFQEGKLLFTHTTFGELVYISYCVPPYKTEPLVRFIIDMC